MNDEKLTSEEVELEIEKEKEFDAWREEKQIEDERRYNDYHERWMHEDF